MITERTEELGLAARLPIEVGGRRVELRTLNLAESEEWLALLSGATIETDLSATLMLDWVLAYDLDHALGTRDDLLGRMTKRELYDALNQMVSAEDPLGEDSRSVVKASGMNSGTSPLMFHLAVQYQQANSMNGHSPTGDSRPRRSAKASPKSSS